jgi:nitrite reductase/ring-hydroxylating ferredoxin subunit
MAWHLLGNLSDFPEPDQGGKEFVIEGQLVAVFRAAEERIFAIDGMCAHQGGPLSQGTLDQKCLTCPWHGWQYDITTGHNVLTGKKMLEVYAVEVRYGEVWIEMGVSDCGSH